MFYKFSMRKIVDVLFKLFSCFQTLQWFKSQKNNKFKTLQPINEQTILSLSNHMWNTTSIEKTLKSLESEK